MGIRRDLGSQSRGAGAGPGGRWRLCEVSGLQALRAAFGSGVLGELWALGPRLGFPRVGKTRAPGECWSRLRVPGPVPVTTPGAPTPGRAWDRGPRACAAMSIWRRASAGRRGRQGCQAASWCPVRPPGPARAGLAFEALKGGRGPL